MKIYGGYSNRGMHLDIPSVKQPPINLMTFGCGSLLTFFKIFNSANKSDMADLVALSENVWKTWNR